jgi:hypothetical protein
MKNEELRSAASGGVIGIIAGGDTSIIHYSFFTLH